MSDSEDEEMYLPLSDRLARTEKKQVQAEEREAEAKEIDNSCPICLDQLEAEYANVDSCPHRFHMQCISNWSTVQNTCPLCNSRFKTIVQTLLAQPQAELQTKAVKSKDQTEKSFRGDVARGYVAEGASLVKAMKEQARLQRQQQRQLQKQQQQQEKQQQQEELQRRRPARTRRQPAETPEALEVAPQEEKMPTRRRGKTSKLTPSEEEQELWAMAESLRLAGIVECAAEAESAELPSPVEEKKAKCKKSVKAREKPERAEDGIKWIRSKITGKWMRARVGNSRGFIPAPCFGSRYFTCCKGEPSLI